MRHGGASPGCVETPDYGDRGGCQFRMSNEVTASHTPRDGSPRFSACLYILFSSPNFGHQVALLAIQGPGVNECNWLIFLIKLEATKERWFHG